MPEFVKLDVFKYYNFFIILMKTLIFYLNIVILRWYFFKVCLLLFRVLVSNFTEDQLNRYEMYRRAAFPKASIKRVKYFVFHLILYAFIFTG